MTIIFNEFELAFGEYDLLKTENFDWNSFEIPMIDHLEQPISF